MRHGTRGAIRSILLRGHRFREAFAMSDSATIQLDARYYRALPIDNPGYDSVTFELPIRRTALIGLHF